MAAVVGDAKRYQFCPAIFGCGVPNESAAGADPLKSPNVDKAKKLIADAGAKAGRIVLMDPADNSTLHPAALMGAQVLRRMGLDVAVQAMDWSTVTQRRASKAKPEEGGWNAFITNATVTGISNPLIHNFVRNCEQAWYGWPCEPRIVELTRAWGLEVDPSKRAEIIHSLQRLHLENVSYVPLGQYKPAIIFRKELSGVIPGPAIFYWNITKTKS